MTLGSLIRIPAEFLVFNAEFLVFNAEFLVLNAEFLVLNAEFLVFYSPPRVMHNMKHEKTRPVGSAGGGPTRPIKTGTHINTKVYVAPS